MAVSGFGSKSSRWLRASLQPATLLGLLMIAACWIGVVVELKMERGKTMDAAVQQAANIARLFEENTVRTLEGVDRTLLLLREAYERDPPHFDLRDWSRQTAHLGELTVQLGLIGPDGYTVDMTAVPGVPSERAYVGDRDHFRAQVDAQTDELYIGKPVIGRLTGRLTIQISRRLRHPDGSFAGTLAASIDPGFVEKFFKTFDLGPQDSVLLRRLDGVILASRGFVRPSDGRIALQPALAEALARGPAGHFWGGGAVDGVNRLVSYRAAEKYPLLLVFGITESSVFEAYQRTRLAYVTIAAVVTLLILAAVAAGIRHELQLGEANGALDAANEHLLAQNLRFEAALNNMSQGLCFFDGAQRLIVCNSRYIEMYGLAPDRVHPGTTLGEIVDLRFEAGSFPAMSKEDYLVWRNSIAVSDEPCDSTVELKNGRIFRICHRAMPDSGWVATHEDVTERARAEKSVARAQADAERAQQDAQAAHARLLEAFEVVPEGLALWDADDRIVLWNSRYTEMYGATGEAIVAGARFEDVLRAGLARGQYAEAVGRDEEWLAARLARHALPSNTHEQQLPPDRWVRVQERRTSDGGSIGIRIDITELKQREESFRLLFDSNPVPMWVAESETLKFLAVNAAAVAHYGYSQEQFLQMTALDLRSADDRDAFNGFIQAGGNSKGRKVWRHQKADGTGILVSIYSGNLTYAERAARLCAVVDVTERARAEDKLLQQKLRTDTAINNMSQGLLMFDDQARLLLCNDRYIEMYRLSSDVVKPGCTLRQLIDHRIEVGLFSGDPEQYCRDVLDGVAKGTEAVKLVELSDGRSVHVVNRPMPGGGWVATHEDITERRQAQARIEYLAHHDPLTDLFNRAAFNDFLSKALESAAKHAEEVAVVCIDLDRFKEVNDVFGHAVGDGLLREISKRLKEAAAGAFLARLGGDEFSLVLTDGPQPGTAEQLTARLQAAASKDLMVDGHALRTGLSIGVAIYPADGVDAEMLLANADAGLYRAKREGRGSVRFFEAQMDQQLRERRALQHDLRSAIAHNQIRLHYQPQALIDGKIIGFEALARWQHPTRGAISPGVFIPLAEDSGLIIQIGEWIFREACREAASWGRPLQVAINLSPVQFQHGDLPALVHSVLLETGLPPSRLELEITESVLVDDFARAVSILRRLKAFGVRIAMDDFGTGYSSLSYLQAFPFDKIKIDQTFIRNLDKNPQSATIIRAVIGLGRGLSLPVMAEGVETKEQLAFLARESCDEVQGYLIGKPRPIEDYAEVIGRRPERRPEILRAV